jgi:hypothetical protein
MVDGWKVTAWIFIILFILENALMFWGATMVNEDENNKLKCSNEICYNLNSDAFKYDIYSKTCACYVDNVVIHQEVLA